MLTQEAFDKIYEELNFEKIDLENFSFIDKKDEKGTTFKENFEIVLKELGGLKDSYNAKIKEVEKQIEEMEKGKTEANTIKFENIIDDKYINEFYNLGVIKDEDINSLISQHNNKINEDKEKENKISTPLLKEYKTHLEKYIESITELNNFWDRFLKKLIEKNEKFQKKKEKLISYRDNRYEKYQEECKKITEKAKENLKKIKSMVVFDEKAYKDKIKSFNEIENKLKGKTDELYNELKNKKEVIKKYWKFSFKTVISAAIIGFTIPFTAGASAGVAIGIAGASAGLSIGAEGIDGFNHSMNGYEFKGADL